MGMETETGGHMDYKAREERILSREEAFRGRLLTVERWQALLPSGKTAPREVALHVGGAAAAAVDGRGSVTLVAQYRIALGKTMLELPAGKKDSPSEDALVCAQRELREETGLTARRWRHLATIDTSPGFLTERIGVFLATDLARGDARPDEDEELALVSLPLDEAVALIHDGTITDAKTIVGLLLARELLGREGGPPA